jgi:hypothetical protein
MISVFKKIGLPALALLVVLMAFSAPANAGVRFGLYVGAPVYTYPYYSYYSYPYPVHHRYYSTYPYSFSSYPYYSYPAYPTYTYGYRTYVYPRHWRVHRHERHEHHSHHRR